MRVLSIHSHKGGAGKTTLAMLLGKRWLERGHEVCIIDLDFVGPGIEDAVRIRKPQKTIEEVLFLRRRVKLQDLLGEVTASGKKLDRPLHVMLNAGHPLVTEPVDDAEDITTSELSAAAGYIEDADGPFCHELRRLLDRLEREGFRRCILDCSPGLRGVSRSVFDSSFVDVRLLISTTDAPHFWGVHREILWYLFTAGEEGEARRARGARAARCVLVVNQTNPEFFGSYDDISTLAADDDRVGWELATVEKHSPIKQHAMVRRDERIARIQMIGPPFRLPSTGRLTDIVRLANQVDGMLGDPVPGR
jgi:CO dehydrogenase nickel-insertion accessory protein CooC1